MAEHVSFFHGRTLPGKREALIGAMKKWEREQKSRAKGFLYSNVVFSNHEPDEFMGAVHWDSTDNYFVNANRPEQDAWYREFRANLSEDPSWFDGTLAMEVKGEQATIAGRR